MPRNKHGKPDFKTDDFVAFQLFAGDVPTHHININDSEYLNKRVVWVNSCNEFQEEYFDPRYPYARWIDFYREYLVWLEFHKEVQQEKDDEKLKSTSPVRTDRTGSDGANR